MPVKHVYTASSGDLISSTIWNDDHTITDAPTMLTVPFVMDRDGSSVTISGTGWHDLPRAVVYIPNSKTLAFTQGHLSIHWMTSVDTPNLGCRIIDSGEDVPKILGEAYQSSAVNGTYYTNLITDLGINSYPVTNTIYKLQVSASIGSGTVYVYTAVLFLEKD